MAMIDDTRATRRPISNVSGADQYAAMGFKRGGGGGGGNSKMLERLKKATKRANKANKRRYRELLGNIDSTRAEGLGLLEGVGQQAAMDIQSQTSRDIAESGQNMVSRGLSGTTIGFGNANMINSLGQQNLNRLNESLALNRLDFISGIEGDRRDIIEGREDTGPNPALLAQLQSMRKGGGGGGGGRRKRFMGDPIFTL